MPFCLSYCSRLPCLSQYTLLYMQKLYIQNCNGVPERTRPLCNSFLFCFERVFKMVTVFALTMSQSSVLVTCHAILHYNSCCKCGQTETWRQPVCNGTAQAVSTNNLLCFLTYSRVCFIRHCEVIFVWNQRHLIFSFRDKCDFCFCLKR